MKGKFKKLNDPDLNIMHVNVTFGGATHNSFIFNHSAIKPHLEQLNNREETVYLLGDSGFALRPFMMVPCNNPEPGSREEYYNNLHASARNTAEQTAYLKAVLGAFCFIVFFTMTQRWWEKLLRLVVCCITFAIMPGSSSRITSSFTETRSKGDPATTTRKPEHPQ